MMMKGDKKEKTTWRGELVRQAQKWREGGGHRKQEQSKNEREQRTFQKWESR